MTSKADYPYSISDLSREFDITTRTIRFYEDKGLITPKRDGQKRLYSMRDRVRLRLILRGKRLGFSLHEIQEMMDLYDTDPSEITQLKVVLSRVKERREILMQQQADLEETLLDLETLQDQCQNLLDQKTRR